MSVVDEGLDAAGLRVAEAMCPVMHPDLHPIHAAPTQADPRLRIRACFQCQREADAIARAAREDVPARERQARADELEDFAHNHVKNQTAGRIHEDLLERAAAIREGRQP